MLELRYFTYQDGSSPFEQWFQSLDSIAASKVTVALARMEQGNFSNCKSVGHAVLEFRIDWGPGYRIYFGRQGEKLVILLTGGTQRRQQRDIASAQEMWRIYKQGQRK